MKRILTILVFSVTMSLISSNAFSQTPTFTVTNFISCPYTVTIEGFDGTNWNICNSGVITGGGFNASLYCYATYQNWRIPMVNNSGCGTSPNMIDDNGGSTGENFTYDTDCGPPCSLTTGTFAFVGAIVVYIN